MLGMDFETYDKKKQKELLDSLDRYSFSIFDETKRGNMRIEDWDRIDIYLKSHPCTVDGLDKMRLGQDLDDNRNEPKVHSLHGGLSCNIFPFFTSQSESQIIIDGLKYEAEKINMGFSIEELEPPPGSFSDIYTYYATFYQLRKEAHCDMDKGACEECPMKKTNHCSPP